MFYVPLCHTSMLPSHHTLRIWWHISHYHWNQAFKGWPSQVDSLMGVTLGQSPMLLPTHPHVGESPPCLLSQIPNSTLCLLGLSSGINTGLRDSIKPSRLETHENEVWVNCRAKKNWEKGGFFMYCGQIAGLWPGLNCQFGLPNSST